MNTLEAVSNIVIALIEQKFISSPTEVSEAYKEIYKAVINPKT